jgi:HK97 family phage major capsid protein
MNNNVPDDGAALVELPAPNTATADGMKSAISALTNACNALVAREKAGRVVTTDEWNKLDEGLRELSGRMKANEDSIRANGGIGFGGNSESMLLEKAALRLDAPDDLHASQRPYFNAVALKFDELAGLSTANAATRSAVGMSENVARAYSSPGASRLAEAQARFQSLNDILLIKDILLAPGANRGPRADLSARRERMKQFREWAEYERLSNEFARAFNEGTSTSGLNWVPAVLSAQMMDMIQAELRVSALFPQVTMTSKTLDWPVLGGDLVAYLMGESTGDGSDSGVTASTATTNKVTFTAQKIAVRTFASSEIIEDSIVSMVNFILGNAAKVIARGVEDALINGDTGTTLDGATFNPAGGVRRAWKGLRFYTFKGAGGSALASATDMGGATVTEAKLLEMQMNMGIYGANPRPFAFITGFRGLKSLMKLSSLLTLEKFGANASIVTGQVGAIFGSPVVLSEFVFDQKATGVYGDGTARTFGTILGVHRDSFAVATRRAISINASSDRYIEQDQTVFVGTGRFDFEPLFTPSSTVAPVGAVYNIV